MLETSIHCHPFTATLRYSHDGILGGKQPGSVSTIVYCPSAGLLIESWAWLPLMVTGLGLKG